MRPRSGGTREYTGNTSCQTAAQVTSQVSPSLVGDSVRLHPLMTTKTTCYRSSTDKSRGLPGMGSNSWHDCGLRLLVVEVPARKLSKVLSTLVAETLFLSTV